MYTYMHHTDIHLFQPSFLILYGLITITANKRTGGHVQTVANVQVD